MVLRRESVIYTIASIAFESKIFPFFSWLANGMLSYLYWAVSKETRWHFRQPQGVTVAPPVPVSGRGQREHHQHIGLCASLIRFFHPQCINQCSCPYTSMYSHRLPNVCFLWTLLSSMFFYASWKASVQFCFAPLFSHPDQPHFVYFSCTQHYCITVYCKTFL